MNSKPLKIALTLIGIGLFVAMCYIVVDMAQMSRLSNGTPEKPLVKNYR